MSDRPWTFGEALLRQREATQKQLQAEDFVKSAYRDFAEAERAYREALATAITTLRADGQPVTLCGDLARGDKHVARLKHARDIADGVREAAQHAIWRATADRRAVESFVSWSQKRNLAEGFAAPEPQWSEPIGGRR